MGLVAVSEAEAGGEVAAEELLLLDVGQENRIDGLLVTGAGAGDLLLLWVGNPCISPESPILDWSHLSVCVCIDIPQASLPA